MEVNRLLEITFVCVVLYLIVVNYQGFSTVVSSLSTTYVAGVKALQGR